MKTKSLVTLCPVLLLFACGGSENVAQEEDYDAVAKDVGALVGQSAGSETSMLDLTADAMTGRQILGVDVPLNASVQGTLGSYLVEIGVVCEDDAGAVITCGDGAERAAVDFMVSGEYDGPRLSAVVTRAGEWTAERTAFDTIEVDGAGDWYVRSNVEAAAGDHSWSHELDYFAEYEDVTYTLDTRRFSAGTIRYDIAVEKIRENGRRETDLSFDVDAVVTFDGDGMATLVLDGTRSYMVDISAGEVDPVQP